MQNRRTRQPVMMVSFAVVICLKFLCASADPAMNWSSRSLAGFRNLFRHNNGGHLLPPIIPSYSKHYRRQYQNSSTNSSLIPLQQTSNIHSRRKPSSNHISKRRLSWNSSPKTLYQSSRTYSGGQQYNSYSRYCNVYLINYKTVNFMIFSLNDYD